MTLTAPAKINLALDVGAKRADGFHTVRTVMQTVSLGDELRVSVGGKGFSFTSDCAAIPADKKTLEQRAAEAFFAAIEREVPPLRVELHKITPAYAGLGGGSADAAALLRALRTQYAPEMPLSELEAIGAQIGSDVPFCLRGGAVLAEGRGEKLTDLPPLPPCHIVICKPEIDLPTAEMFARLDETQIAERPDADALVRALQNGDLRGACQNFGNVFEQALPRGAEAVFSIKRRLLDLGALAAQMSGSGSAVFGVFEKEPDARAAAGELQKTYAQTFLTAPLSKIV